MIRNGNKTLADFNLDVASVDTNNNRRAVQLLMRIGIVSAAFAIALVRNEVTAKETDPQPPFSSRDEIMLEGTRLTGAVEFVKTLEIGGSPTVCEQVWQDILTQAERLLPATNEAYQQILTERTAFLARRKRTLSSSGLIREDDEQVLAQRSSQLLKLARLALNEHAMMKAKKLSGEAFACLGNACANHQHLFDVAQCLELSGDLDNAIRAYTQCVELTEGDPANARFAIQTLAHLSRLQRVCDDVPAVKQSLARSFLIARKAEDDGLTVECLNERLRCLGPLDRGIENATQQELLALARTSRDKAVRISAYVDVANYLIIYGDLKALEGALAEARASIERSVDSSTNVDVGIIYTRSGQCATALGRTNLAQSFFKKAGEIFSRVKSPSSLSALAQNTASWAHCYWLQGDEKMYLGLRRKASGLYRDKNINANVQLWEWIDSCCYNYGLKPPAVREAPERTARLALNSARNTIGSGNTAQYAVLVLSLSELLDNAGYVEKAKPFLNEANNVRKQILERKSTG